MRIKAPGCDKHTPHDVFEGDCHGRMALLFAKTRIEENGWKGFGTPFFRGIFLFRGL